MFGNFFALILFLALINERLVEKLVKPITGNFQGNPVADLSPVYFAMLTGLLIAFGFQLDMITPLVAEFSPAALSPVPGTIVTGLLVGAGSNFLHDVWPKN
jgi:hypothetical protein